MDWSFAIINNKLAEIYFEKNNGEISYIGHCYVKESEYKTKKEKQYIKEDTASLKFIYRNGNYKRKIEV